MRRPLPAAEAFKNASKAWQEEQPEVHLSPEDLAALEDSVKDEEAPLCLRSWTKPPGPYSSPPQRLWWH